MFDQIKEDTLFIIFYSIVTSMAMFAGCYLYFRKGNAFAPDITPPAPLRKWTAAFFAFLALNHMWYMPILFLESEEDIFLNDLIGGVLDCMTVIPLLIVVMLSMLQDRVRPLWPIAVAVAPLVLGGTVCAITRNVDLLPAMYLYALLLGVGLVVFFIREVRRYGRWLRNNYADLEHKEVWQSFLLMAIIMLTLVVYVFSNDGPFYQYAIEVVCGILICYLLWRVETLSDLSISVISEEEEREAGEEEEASASPLDLPLTIRDNIGPMLKMYCEEQQLYLQHDMSISQLAKQIGTNRSYLSRYFAMQGITYNAYINGLRIQHFINLYHEATENHQSVTAQQLAHLSGFRNYNTFSTAFKKMTGKTTSEWMRCAKT